MKSKKLDSNQFTYESNHFSTNELCNRMIITIGFKLSRYDSDYWIESIYDETSGIERRLEDFTPQEQTEIDEAMQAFFDSRYDDFYQEHLESIEDQRYTEYKNQMKYGG